MTQNATFALAERCRELVAAGKPLPKYTREEADALVIYLVGRNRDQAQVITQLLHRDGSEPKPVQERLI